LFILNPFLTKILGRTYKKEKGRTYFVCRRYSIDHCNGYLTGEIPDYQISAWLMAVFFQGMNDDETAALTDAMMRSGDMIDLSSIRWYQSR
jgi:thymidine phosphorylase